jgi:hypothetical protein
LLKQSSSPLPSIPLQLVNNGLIHEWSNPKKISLTPQVRRPGAATGSAAA